MKKKLSKSPKKHFSFAKLTFNTKKIIYIASAVLVLCGASYSAYAFYQYQQTKPLKLEALSLSGTDCSDSKAVELVKPNTVRIENKTATSSIIGTGFFEPTGYLITNSHVVDVPGEITVYYPDGQQSKATMVSNDIVRDIAILSAETSSVKALQWAKTTELKEPDTLIALGFALNLPGEVSVTKGSFSARRDQDGTNYLQTDTPVNSGNSGGPLINACGRVVGINSLSIDNASINMAISAESASSIISELIAAKKVTFYDGTGRNTALSKLLKVAGFEEIANNLEIKNKSEDEARVAEVKSESSKDKVATKQKSSGGSGNNGGSIPPSNPSSTYQPYVPKVTCKPISIMISPDQNNSLEINQTTSVSMYADNSDGAVPEWSGPGTFTKGSYNLVTWSSDTAGKFEIIGTIKSKYGECSSKATIEVLAPLRRVEDLVKVSLSGGWSQYSTTLKTDVIQFSSELKNQADSSITYVGRNWTLPLTAHIEIFKTVNYSEKADRIYIKDFSYNQIKPSYNYKTSTITIPISDLGLTSTDYTDGQINLWYEATAYTPEQGSFLTSSSFSLRQN